MARARKEATSELVEQYPIPDDWKELIGELAEDPAYQRAWAHAKSKDNSDKGAHVYAESHWQDHEDEDGEGA